MDDKLLRDNKILVLVLWLKTYFNFMLGISMISISFLLIGYTKISMIFLAIGCLSFYSGSIIYPKISSDPDRYFFWIYLVYLDCLALTAIVSIIGLHVEPFWFFAISWTLSFVITVLLTISFLEYIADFLKILLTLGIVVLQVIIEVISYPFIRHQVPERMELMEGDDPTHFHNKKHIKVGLLDRILGLIIGMPQK